MVCAIIGFTKVMALVIKRYLHGNATQTLAPTWNENLESWITIWFFLHLQIWNERMWMEHNWIPYVFSILILIFWTTLIALCTNVNIQVVTFFWKLFTWAISIVLTMIQSNQCNILNSSFQLNHSHDFFNIYFDPPKYQLWNKQHILKTLAQLLHASLFFIEVIWKFVSRF